MCVQKLKAEKDFYKSLYRQVRQDSVNESKPVTSANLPPKSMRKFDESYKHMQSLPPFSSHNKHSSHTSMQTSVEVTFDGDNLDMFDLLGAGVSPEDQLVSIEEEESKLSMYMEQTPEDDT